MSGSLRIFGRSRVFYGWAPGVAVFRADSGALYLCDGDSGSTWEVEPERPEAACVVEELYAVLDRPRTLSDICTRVHEPGRTLLGPVIQALIEHGCLVAGDGDARNRAHGAVSPPMMLVGDPVIVRGVKEALAEAGVACTVVPGDRSSVRNGAARRSVLERREFLDAVDAAVAAADDGAVVLIARCGDDPVLECESGRICAGAGRASLSVTIRRTRAELGPFVRPGLSACAQCKLLRRLAAAREYRAESQFLRFLARRDRRLGGPVPAPAVLRLTTGALAAALADRSIERAAGLVNAVVTISEDPLAIQRHRVIKMPGCGCCAAARGHVLRGRQ